MCCAPAWAQTYTDSIGQHSKLEVESAYTLAESQLGQNADMPQGVTMVNSNKNVFASEVSYRFAPTHLRYRAYNPMYNEVYINGVPMNNAAIPLSYHRRHRTARTALRLVAAFRIVRLWNDGFGRIEQLQLPRSRHETWPPYRMDRCQPQLYYGRSLLVCLGTERQRMGICRYIVLPMG